MEIPAIGASVRIGDAEISNRQNKQTKIRNPRAKFNLNSATLRLGVKCKI
jgi:hypothetical protein